jgi:hypothetical protein
MRPGEAAIRLESSSKDGEVNGLMTGRTVTVLRFPETRI